MRWRKTRPFLHYSVVWSWAERDKLWTVALVLRKTFLFRASRPLFVFSFIFFCPRLLAGDLVAFPLFVCVPHTDGWMDGGWGGCVYVCQDRTPPSHTGPVCPPPTEPRGICCLLLSAFLVAAKHCRVQRWCRHRSVCVCVCECVMAFWYTAQTLTQSVSP